MQAASARLIYIIHSSAHGLAEPCRPLPCPPSRLAFVALFLLPASRLELLLAWLGFSFAFLLDGFGFVCLGVARRYASAAVKVL